MKHYEVCCALIENENNEILCCKRGPGRVLEGQWEFPGGKVEQTETHEQTIIREINEELKIVVVPVKYLGKSSYEYTNIKPYKDFSITLYAYQCKLLSGKITLTEHTDYKWVKLNDMNIEEFAPADRCFIIKN